MGTAKAVVLVLTIKAALVGGPGFYQDSASSVAPSVALVVRPATPNDTFSLDLKRFALNGGSMTFDSRSDLLIVSEPSPQTAASLFRQGQYMQGQLVLQTGSGGERKVTLKLPEAATVGGRTAYLEEAGPGLYRRKDLAQESGCTITVSLPDSGGAVGSVAVELAHQQLTPEGLDPALGAYVGRPSVRRKELTAMVAVNVGRPSAVGGAMGFGGLAVAVGVGRPLLLYWGPEAVSAQYDRYDTAYRDWDGSTRPNPLTGPAAPAVAQPAPAPPAATSNNADTSWTPPTTATPSAVPLVSNYPAGKSDYSSQCRLPGRPLAVLLELKEQGGELATSDAAAGQQEQATAVQPAAPAVDRELIEAKIRELRARSDEALAKLDTAKQKLAIVTAQYTAGLVTAEEKIDQQGAVALAQAEIARLKAEIDTQQILLKRAGGGGLAVVTVAGGVRTPGVYALAPGESIATILTKAGGPAPGSDLDHVVIIRRTGTPGQVAPVLCVSVDRNALNQPAHLQDGDTVYVPGVAGGAAPAPPATFMPGGPGSAPAPPAPAVAPVPAPAPPAAR